MNHPRFTFSPATVIACALLFIGCTRQASAPKVAPAPAKIKIGYVVKAPEEPWFQLEWKFADQAAAEFDFDVIKIGATDGEKVLAAIDNLAAAGAQGVLVCTPDTRLGPAIVAKAKAAGLKLLSIDDQFVGGDGQPMKEVHFHGLSATKVGEDVGTTLAAEMKRRGWTPADTALCAVTFDELATARERVGGAITALEAGGFPAERVFTTAQRTTDIPGAFDATGALLTRHSDVRHWLVCGVNDNTVLGAVRALEGRGFGADRVIGIGINGTDCIVELEKTAPTGFFGSMFLSPKQHGYATAVTMFKWIKDGVEPPLDARTTGILITRDNFRQVLKEQGVE